MSAVELCTYAGELSGLPRTEAMQRAHAALYYAGLEEKRYQPIDGYSTGMKQRVKLAQALVHDPELLFLDEPTNGLDPRSRDEMLELITDLPDAPRLRDRAVDAPAARRRARVRPRGDHAQGPRAVRRHRSTSCAARAAATASSSSRSRPMPTSSAAALTAAGATVQAVTPVQLAGRSAGGRDERARVPVRARRRRAGARDRGAARESLEAAFLRVIGEAADDAATGTIHDLGYKRYAGHAARCRRRAGA